MADCLDKIQASIDCNPDVIVPGIKNRIFIMNFDDVDKSACTFNSSNPIIMENIALLTASPAATAFYLDGQKNSNLKECTFAPSKFVNGWNHKITARIFDNDPIAKKRVEELSNSKVMVIVENIYDNLNKVGSPSDSRYELYGFANGLNAAAINNTDADTRGGWYLELSSLADYPEPKPPYAIFKTDAATTKLLVEGLL